VAGGGGRSPCQITLGAAQRRSLKALVRKQTARGVPLGRWSLQELRDKLIAGVPLGEDEYVLSADEKTSIQARCPLPPDATDGCGQGHARRA
jgi:hypothetical protein